MDTPPKTPGPKSPDPESLGPETPGELRRHAATLRALLLSLPRDARPAARPALLVGAAWLEAAAAVLPPAEPPAEAPPSGHP